MIDLTFVKPGDRYATRAGWTATIERINGFRVEGFIDTDYTRHTAVWSVSGASEAPSDELTSYIDNTKLTSTSPLAKFASMVLLITIATFVIGAIGYILK